MKFLPVVLLFSGTAAQACPKCRPLVEAGVHNGLFAQNMMLMTLPLALLLLVGAGLYFAEPLWEKFA